MKLCWFYILCGWLISKKMAFKTKSSFTAKSFENTQNNTKIRNFVVRTRSIWFYYFRLQYFQIFPSIFTTAWWFGEMVQDNFSMFTLLPFIPCHVIILINLMCKWILCLGLFIPWTLRMAEVCNLIDHISIYLWSKVSLFWGPYLAFTFSLIMSFYFLKQSF